MRRTLIASTLALLAVPAAAATVTLRGETLYGGGALPGPPGTEQMVALHLSASAKRLTFWNNVVDLQHVQQCSPTPTLVVKSVSVSGNGSFKSSAPFVRDSYAGRYRLSGRFVRPDEAFGTLRVTYTATDGTTACDSGAVHWRVWAPGLGLGSGVARDGALYGGQTSQRSQLAPDVREPILLKVGGGGHQVARIAASVNATCADGTAAGGIFGASDVDIKSGSFGSTSTYTGPLGPGRTGAWTWVVRGSFGRQRVSGTWKLSVVVRDDASGAVVDRCGGKVIHWRAAR